ncbi:hypothetical protein DSO57_1009805 [Entomophthora muscae]|uniref:Uncharacterized protein n=1 Tax=Entomophthora muscae TaxID=34485 RepID=A0ACC2RXT8_9FUNG|nr:hypothetical protein DSO57_1009805 [Entomophthora muscae]
MKIFTLLLLCCFGVQLGSLGKKVQCYQHRLCGKSEQVSGFIMVRKRRIAFWYFESRRGVEKDPLLVWLGGGPGVSALFGTSTPLLPCSINTWIENSYSWNDNAHLLVVDLQPNVGFSGTTTRKKRSFEEDLPFFLDHFYITMSHLRENKVHIFGESFGGSWIPSAVKSILDRNNASPKNFINLASLGLGSPLIFPSFQFRTNNLCSLAMLTCAAGYECQQQKIICLSDFVSEEPKLILDKSIICPSCQVFNAFNPNALYDLAELWAINHSTVSDLKSIKETIPLLIYSGKNDSIIHPDDLQTISQSIAPRAIRTTWLDLLTLEPIGTIYNYTNTTLVLIDNASHHVTPQITKFNIIASH